MWVYARESVFVNPPTGSGKSLCYAALPFVFDALRETSARAAADQSLPSSPVVVFKHAHTHELQTLCQRPSLVHNLCQMYFFEYGWGCDNASIWTHIALHIPTCSTAQVSTSQGFTWERTILNNWTLDRRARFSGARSDWPEYERTDKAWGRGYPGKWSSWTGTTGQEPDMRLRRCERCTISN